MVGSHRHCQQEQLHDGCCPSEKPFSLPGQHPSFRNRKRKDIISHLPARRELISACCWGVVVPPEAWVHEQGYSTPGSLETDSWGSWGLFFMLQTGIVHNLSTPSLLSFQLWGVQHHHLPSQPPSRPFFGTRLSRGALKQGELVQEACSRKCCLLPSPVAPPPPSQSLVHAHTFA